MKHLYLLTKKQNALRALFIVHMLLFVFSASAQGEWTNGTVSTGGNGHRDTHIDFQLGTNGENSGRILVKDNYSRWYDFINFKCRWNGTQKKMSFWQDATFKEEAWFQKNVIFRTKVTTYDRLESQGLLVLGGDINCNPATEFNFGQKTRQMLNLFNATYGIGVQSNTLYFRSSSGTNSGFAWFNGGGHDNGLGNPGSGGKTYMVLRKGRLAVGPNLEDGYVPKRTLEVFGPGHITGNFTVDGDQNVQQDLIATNITVREKLLVTTDIQVPSIKNPNGGFLMGASGNVDINSLDNIHLFAGPAGSPPKLSVWNDGTITTGAEINSSESIRGLNFSVKGEIIKDPENEKNHLTVRGDLRIKALSDGTRANLFVDNEIIAEDFEITPGTSGAPDYVFEENYRLIGIESLEKYVSEHHHLPNVPSAKEIEEEGYNLTSMDFSLLEKVEELALYVIDLNKQNKQLKAELEVLKKSIQRATKD